jgi:hypothetical protein
MSRNIIIDTKSFRKPLKPPREDVGGPWVGTEYEIYSI